LGAAGARRKDRPQARRACRTARRRRGAAHRAGRGPAAGEGVSERRMSVPATRSVYLDYAAGAPLRPAAARVLSDALASGAGNASSVHWAGARARALLESAREEVAAAIGAR